MLTQIERSNRYEFTQFYHNLSPPGLSSQFPQSSLVNRYYLYFHKIVGHYLSDTLDTDSVIQAVKEAVETHGIPAILNSDQGCQFTSSEYKSLLKELHIRQSMDGKSRWADNIMIERWFRSLKNEQIYPNEYHSPKELRKLINEYVDAYNRERLHEALDYKVPDVVYYGTFAA